MADDLIRYDLLVQEALRGVVRKVLSDASRDGLPGEHHFYITFKTHADGVRLSPRMRNQYPSEMTIILQHQFWGLNVTDQGFEVGLSFKNIPETLFIPFDAMTGFFDPSVQFVLKFESEIANDGEALPESQPQASDAPAKIPATAVDHSSAQTSGTGLLPPPQTGEQGAQAPAESKVISFDAFRKKT